jgi:hypothetical protein
VSDEEAWRAESRRFEAEARRALNEVMLHIPADDAEIFREYAIRATLERLSEQRQAIKDIGAHFVALSVAYLMAVPCSEKGTVH